ncbi:MAG TPA: acido-empty-quinoprotein group A [Bryobacteraceae bacterium]|nr:acido-empty-quinoprotein group A [Bryobacteraceae bacterium]
MRLTKLILLSLTAVLLGNAQQVTQADLNHPKPDSWPTFNGDYSGKRYSPLKQIHSGNVQNLTLAWIGRVNMQSTPTYTGGEGPVPQGMVANNRGTPLLVDGVLYMTEPNAMFAIDARTGREIWHYAWKGLPAESLGNRGAGIYGDWLYFETPDCHLVSLDRKTGKERFNQVIADVKQDHWCSFPPTVIKNHVIVGVGGDFLDMANYIESRDPETGALQWHTWTTAHPGDPGFSTWPNEQAAAHGGGGVWTAPTYDPELNLLYVGTGNVEPTFVGQSRPGDNLYTCSTIALNADTGKMAWYFQFSPHDTHDWDGSQIPVLADMPINGQPRKLLLQAYRGGLFFVIDRTNGKSISTTPFVEHLNWFKGIAPNGQPIRDPEKEPSPAGTLTAPNSSGSTGYPSPAFNPDTGLFYVGTTQPYVIFYKVDNDPQPEGYGAVEHQVGNIGTELRAIDYKTGKIVWKRPLNIGAQNLMTTAGNLLFGSDGSGNFIAWDAKTGVPLWHSTLLSNPGNGPITYMLDGKQYVVVAAGEDFYAFTLQGAVK